MIPYPNPSTIRCSGYEYTIHMKDKLTTIQEKHQTETSKDMFVSNTELDQFVIQHFYEMDEEHLAEFVENGLRDLPYESAHTVADAFGLDPHHPDYIGDTMEIIRLLDNGSIDPIGS